MQMLWHRAWYCSRSRSVFNRCLYCEKAEEQRKNRLEEENVNLEIEIAFYFNLEMKNICEYFYTDCFLNKTSL